MIDYEHFYLETLVKRNVMYVCRTVFEAKLRFTEDVAPKDRKEIAERINGESWKNPGKNLNAYLRNAERIDYNTEKKTYEDTNKEKERKIRIKKRKLGIDIKVVSPHAIRNSQIFDVDTLNKFILTGEIPDKPNI